MWHHHKLLSFSGKSVIDTCITNLAIFNMSKELCHSLKILKNYTQKLRFNLKAICSTEKQTVKIVTKPLWGLKNFPSRCNNLSLEDIAFPNKVLIFILCSYLLSSFVLFMIHPPSFHCVSWPYKQQDSTLLFVMSYKETC